MSTSRKLKRSSTIEQIALNYIEGVEEDEVEVEGEGEDVVAEVDEAVTRAKNEQDHPTVPVETKLLSRVVANNTSDIDG